MTNTSTTMLILTSASVNSNKFYEVTVDGNQVTARYGRVGAKGQTKVYSGGEAKASSLIASKKAKGYTEAQIASTTAGAARGSLAKASHDGMTAPTAKGNADIAELIDLLVAQNKHQIMESSGGQITVQDGQVATPLGLLTNTAIAQARGLLAQMRNGYPPVNVALLEQYLRLVPQNVGTKRGWEDSFISGPDDFVRQSQFLDQLQASLDFASAQNTAADGPSVAFRYQLAPSEASMKGQMQAEYDRTANARHGSIASARVKAVYDLIDTSSTAEFDDLASTWGNVRSMWHGTRAFNVLSLAAKGFMMPNPGSFNYTASMFGAGLYFSDQSSKSANYARGGLWSAGRDSRWFMLRCDVVMGREYWPNKDPHAHSRRYDDVLAGKVNDILGNPYHSINVKAGTSGVLNHEAIVGRLAQVKPRYLVEFAG